MVESGQEVVVTALLAVGTGQEVVETYLVFYVLPHEVFPVLMMEVVHWVFVVLVVV